MDLIKTNNKKLNCVECKNDFDVSDKAEGEVCECPYCGIEYEIVSEKEGEYDCTIIEEEK